MRILMREHQELARLLMEDPEADRCEMGARLFNELTALRELHEREPLTKANDALEEKDLQNDQFIAVLAHELRNPLAVVRAAADALGRMELEDPKIERLRERILKPIMKFERTNTVRADCRPAGLSDWIGLPCPRIEGSPRCI
jgi:signal transduction histidine kinase